MLRKICSILLCCAVLFSCTGCSFQSILNKKYKNDFEQYTENAKENTMSLLQKKYPDKTFTITNTSDYKCDSYIGLEKYSETIFVTIEDEDGKQFEVITNGSLSGENGIKETKDNIQNEAIQKAIYEKIIEIFKLTKEQEEHLIIEYPQSDSYHTYFDGDIIKFVNESNDFNEKHSTQTIGIKYFSTTNDVDLNSIDEENLSFLSYCLLDIVKFNSNDMMIQLLNSDFLKYNLENSYFPYINSKVTFDRKSKTFKTLNVEIKNDKNIYYTVPYQDFELVDVNMNTEPDLTQWKTEIDKYKKSEINEWKKCTIITDTFKMMGNGYKFFAKKPQNTPENAKFLLFKDSEFGKYIIEVQKPDKSNHIFEVGDYISLFDSYINGEDLYFIVMIEY